jgi:hypothetical protein
MFLFLCVQTYKYLDRERDREREGEQRERENKRERRERGERERERERESCRELAGSTALRHPALDASTSPSSTLRGFERAPRAVLDRMRLICDELLSGEGFAKHVDPGAHRPATAS